MLAGALIATIGFWTLFYSLQLGVLIILAAAVLFVWDMRKQLMRKEVQQESLEEFFDRQDGDNDKKA